MKVYNINSLVSYRLTKFGAELRNKYFETDKFKAGDICEDQLWLFMKIFGGNNFMGMESPVWDCNLFLDEDYLKDAESIQEFEERWDYKDNWGE